MSSGRARLKPCRKPRQNGIRLQPLRDAAPNDRPTLPARQNRHERGSPSHDSARVGQPENFRGGDADGAIRGQMRGQTGLTLFPVPIWGCGTEELGSVPSVPGLFLVVILRKRSRTRSGRLPNEGPMQLDCCASNVAAPPFAPFERACPERSRRVGTTGLDLVAIRRSKQDGPHTRAEAQIREIPRTHRPK